MTSKSDSILDWDLASSVDGRWDSSDPSNDASADFDWDFYPGFDRRSANQPTLNRCAVGADSHRGEVAPAAEVQF